MILINKNITNNYTFVNNTKTNHNECNGCTYSLKAYQNDSCKGVKNL